MSSLSAVVSRGRLRRIAVRVQRSESGARSATVPESRASARGGGMLDFEHLRRRQREEFGGLSWGSAFFGWLVAIGLAALLIAVVGAAGAAVGLTGTGADGAAGSAETIGLAGGIALLAILVIAYYAGGYVAGRMARFNGLRQGLAVWLLGLVVTLVLAVAVAVAGVVLGAEYNVLETLNLPRIPVDEGSLSTGAVIALAAIAVGSLLAAVAGGKAGSHYHRKIDRAGLGEPGA
jgi:hypothetical protein